MMPQMENNEPLDYPKSKQRANLYTHCGFCKRNLSTDICFENGKKLKYCEHLDKHYFKVYVKVPGTNNERKTKKLETRDADEAIKMAIDFEREVKGSVPQGYKTREIEKGMVRRDEYKSNLLIHILAKYLAWLNNEGIPEELAVVRTKDHIKEIERASMFLVECIVKAGYDLNTFSVQDIDYLLVGQVVKAYKAKGLANQTINHRLTYFTSIIKWYSETTSNKVRNYFKEVRLPVSSNPKEFPMEEFEALLKLITPENGIGYDDGVKPRRNYYYFWLVFAFRLAILTGRRREELTRMVWTDIKEINGELCLLVEDIKVNRIKRRVGNQKRYNPTPVTPELMLLLNEMGYEKYKGTNNYILAPEVNISRGKVMCNILSRSFAHYYKQLNTGKNLTFKSFRKTNFTELQIKYGDNARFISGHPSTNTLAKKYVDPNALAVKLMKMDKEATRQNQLENIRIESKNNEQQKDINR